MSSLTAASEGTSSAGPLQELDCFLRNGVVFGNLRAPKPIDAVAQPSIPVKPVRLSNQLPIGNTNSSKELPHVRHLQSAFRILEANVVELYNGCRHRVGVSEDFLNLSERHI